MYNALIKSNPMNSLPPLIKNQITTAIKAAFKPYEAAIKDAESSYKLKTLALQVDSLNLTVSKDIMHFFELCKKRAIMQIYKKIELDYNKEHGFSLENIKSIIKDNKIEKEVSTAVISAINSPKLINLSLEDCYTVFKNSNKIHSFKLEGDNLLKNKLKLAKIKSAIVIIYGTSKTKLNDLKQYWDLITSEVPKVPVGFSYNVECNLKKERMYVLIGY